MARSHSSPWKGLNKPQQTGLVRGDLFPAPVLAWNVVGVPQAAPED